uniref:Putative zinc-finger domain-containing protein n=1 Tax=Ramularia collo-cygni TaxID=112498 RepID=A0A2D3VKR6_9PEZI
MSSQRPAFYFGGPAPNQQPPPPQNHAPAPPLTNGTPVVPNQPQQMAFQQNAGLPGVDLSALNINISAAELMTIARLLQSGQLTLPPPGPGAYSIPAVGPPPAPVPASAVTPQASAPLNGGDVGVNMDREEGELEDDEGAQSTHALYGSSVPDSSVQAHVTQVNSTQAAPSRPHPAQPTSIIRNGQSSDGGHVADHPAKVVESRNAPASAPVTDVAPPSIAVKAFVLELHRVGYGFEDLAREVGNTPSLRNLYQQIGLPLPSQSGEPSASAKQSIAPRVAFNGAVNTAVPGTQAKAQLPTPGRPQIAVKTIANTTAAAKPDRASYLAKLQAAKNKKSEPVLESPTTNHVQSPTTPAAVRPPSQHASATTETLQHAAGKQSAIPQSAGASASQAPASQVVDSSRTNGAARTTRVTFDTELVRQRLAKLQAERAAAHNAQKLSSDASMPETTSWRAEGTLHQTQSQPHATVMPALPTVTRSSPVVVDRETTHQLPPRTSAAASPSIARGSGLPGLFTTRTPVQQESSPVRLPVELPRTQVPAQAQDVAAAAAVPTQSPAKSPAPLNQLRPRPVSGQQAPWGGPSAPKRPFGENGMQHEAFIIETSSDEDDGSEMDTDDSTGQQSPGSESKSLPARPIGLLPDFPPAKVDPQRAVSTPGTPSIDLKRKLEELQVAKKRLEELKRRKVNGKPTASTQAPSTQSPGAALTARSSMSLSDAATPAAEMGQQSPSIAPFSSKQQEKEALRKRLQELEDSLGRKLPATSNVPLPTSETTAHSAPDQSEEQTMVATDEDDDDDGDLYEPETLDSFADEQSSGPRVNVEAEESGDEEGESYEPAAFGATGGTDTRLQISSDSGRIGSQATTHSVTSNPDAASSQLAAEMDAAMANAVGPNTGMNNGQLENIKLAQQESDAIEVAPDAGRGGNGTEDREVLDDDSDEDMYEPSTAHAPQQPIAGDRTHPVETEQDRDEHDDDNNEAMDISSDDSDSDSNSSDDQSSEDYEPEENPAQASSDRPESMSAAQDHGGDVVPKADPVRPSTEDDVAHELQSAADQHVAVVENAPASGYYKPYTSMLTRFKEYRYHPDFIENVPGGHKSLTYSNNIDHEKPICPFEIGGRCNDKDCQFQHFKTMALSDNDLLREIGTRKIPAKGAEEEKAWRDGLTAVVKELRSTNRGKDVAVIAQRIAEYRRDFIGDPTKTLMLD